MDVRTVCAVGGIVIPGVWWLSSRMKGVADRLKEGDERFKKFEECFEKVQARLDGLPCHNWKPEECPPKKASHHAA